MPRRAGFYWDKREQAYRTETGGRTKYFRGIAKEDHTGIAAAFAEYLAGIDAASRPVEPLAEDVCVAFKRAARGVTPRTARTHKERFVVWLEWDPGDGEGIIGDRRASTLEPKHLRGALREWADAGRADHYRAGIARSVKAAFAWAASEDGGRMIAANPFAEVKVPSVGRSPERYAGRAEVAAFLRYLRWRGEASPGVGRRFVRTLALLVRVAAHTGARPGELCAAWWGDFDSERGAIVLPPDRWKNGRKTKKSRTIFMTPTLVRALEREGRREGHHPISIFTHRRGKGGGGRAGSAEAGKPWGTFTTLPNGKPSFEANSSALAKRVRLMRSEAIAEGARRVAAGERTWGLELLRDEGDNRFVMYQLRHTTASDHLMNDGNAATVAELLGTSVQMLQTTYGHLLDDHLARAHEELSAKRRGRGRA